MNKKERKIIEEAPQHLTEENGDFVKGLDILAHLVGQCFPSAHATGESIPIIELMNMPESEFQARLRSHEQEKDDG